MLTTIFAKGLILGLLMTGGFGPMALLCLRRSLARGFLAGVMTGFGAAFADALCTVIGLFSIHFITDFLTGKSFFLQMLGGFFFIIAGVKTIFTQPKKSPTSRDLGFIPDITSSFLLTLASPTTLIAVMALTTGLGLDVIPPHLPVLATLMLAVFIGSFTWWITVSVSAQYIRTKINDATLQLINNLCGTGLIIFGCVTLANLVLAAIM